jgi:hypothetical protein
MRSLFLLILLFTSINGYSNTINGNVADLDFNNIGEYTRILLKNNTSDVIVCHWGINGRQWISYISDNSQSDFLYFDNNLYNIEMVSFSCLIDKQKEHKIGTFKKYSNKYN